MERLIRAMEERRPARDQFEMPTFDELGDVEYFIRQFEEVAEVNRWG